VPDDFDITIGLSLQESTLKFQLLADSNNTLSNIIAFPGYIPSNSSDYFIIPKAAGVILSVQKPYPFWSFELWGHKVTMSFVGVTNLQSGYMITSDDPWDTEINFENPWDENYYTLNLHHVPSKGKFGYNRTFYYTFIANKGYVEMCRLYRTHVEELGYVKTFQEKMATNPNMEKLLGAVDFWALDYHFKSVAFIDTLLDFGIDRAIISLGSSWYNSQQLSELIDSINTRGLLSSRYDIYTDVWPPTHPDLYWYRTEGYPEDVIVNADGSLREGWLSYLEDGTPFQGYHICSETHTRYAQERIALDLESNRYNCRFIDVELASLLKECYSPIHPVTRREDAIYRTQLMDLVKNGFGLVTGGEEAKDFAFPVVDYGEGTMTIVPANYAGYDWATPTDDPGEGYGQYNMNPAVRIPLHSLVYHDVHIPTWYTWDGISKVPSFWDDKDLFNILYATMPLFMPPSKEYWNTNREKFITSYFLTASVFRSAGFDRMTDHKILSPDWKVQQTSFSSGWEVVANFGSTGYEYEGVVLHSKGFYATNGEYEVYKLLNGTSPLAAARLPDRLFINPYNQEIVLDGLRTQETVLLKKYEDYLHLAFIGDQKYVDINPELLPWPISSTKIYTNDKSNEIQPESLSYGWLRINKFADKLFYRIEGDFNGLSVEADALNYSAQNFSMNIYPNPFNNETAIHYHINKAGIVELKLFNILGELVEAIIHKQQEAMSYQVAFSSNNLASGIYFLQLKLNNGAMVKKIVVLK